jgi:hypothetical protein
MPLPLELGPPKSRRCRVRPDRYLSPTHSPSLYVSISTVMVTQSPEEGARALHPLVTSFIRLTRNGVMTRTTGGPLARALDALHRPGPTVDMIEGGHSQPIVSVLLPIPAPNDGGRRLVGVVHTTLTAALSPNREVPDGVRAPLVATALPAQIATSGLFLTVHPHAIHTPNRTPLLKTLLLSPPYQK